MRRWNGWGDEQTKYPLSDFAHEYLERILGTGSRIIDASLEEVNKSVPASRLPRHPLISFDPEDRLRHSCGQSLPDWINLRSGKIPNYPDGVTYPSSVSEVRDIIGFAREHGFVIIPYGGGTSVVGHINPPQLERPVLSIDLSKFNQTIDVNQENHLATFEAGIRGIDIEANLQKQGYTLGHFPQSFEFSTLGGWIATRSSGQQSYYYGRIEDMFQGGQIETLNGPIDLPPFPASAAGPDIKQLVLGSEGRFGIITKAIVSVRPVAGFEGFYGIFFKDWESGLQAVKKIAQREFRLSMIRLSDAQETETTLVLSGNRRLISWANFGLDLAGYKNRRCLLIIAVTGSTSETKSALQAAKQVIRKNGGLFIGRYIGNSWEKSRFLAPYLRNSLWEFGYALDTLETASTWEKIQKLKDRTISAIVEANNHRKDKVHVFGHISHVYQTGASIYVTYIFRRSVDPDENLERWQAIKQSASQAIIENGGTISHQHGVGQDHAPFMEKEKGQLGRELLSDISRFFDPNHLMNPGKMFN